LIGTISTELLINHALAGRYFCNREIMRIVIIGKGLVERNYQHVEYVRDSEKSRSEIYSITSKHFIS
jgi:hypothetical protein